MRTLLTSLLCALLLPLGAHAGPDLSAAINRGDTAQALKLINDPDEVRTADTDGTTALHWAVYRDNVAVVKALLQAGASVDVENQFGSTPLLEAAVIGNVVVLEALLKAGADVDAKNADGQTALMVIARTSNVEAARLLIRRGADVNAREKWQGQTALMWASAQKQPAMVAELVRRGARVDERATAYGWERQVTSEPRYQARPAGGMTPLLFASRAGCLECARILVKAGADVDLADPQGVTPLIMATDNLSFDVVAFLLDAGANPNKWDWWGRTPLYLAVDMNTLPYGGRPDRPSLDSTTSLQLIRELLAVGANPNAQLKLQPPFRHQMADRGLDDMLTIGTTPLVRAAKAGDSAAAALLLEHGANPNLPNSLGITPVMAASGIGSMIGDTRGRFVTNQASIETLKLLLAKGGEINAGNPLGQTPLHGAAFWGWNDVVQFLVDNGADLHAKDANGKTPLDSAMGRAGGHGRRGQTIMVFKETADLIERLMSGTAQPDRPTAQTAP